MMVEHMKLVLKTAVTRVFNDYARSNGFLKAKDKNLEGSDTRED